MKRLIIATAVVAAGVFLADRSPAADVMNKAAFEALLAKVQAGAATAKPDPNDPLLQSLRSQSYGEESLEPLRATLTTLPSTEAGLYTAGRILVPLLSSEVAVVRKAVPSVVAAQGKLVKYQSVPMLSKADLKALELPSEPDPKANAEIRLRVLSEYSERRQKRMETETRVLRTNVQSMVFEKVVWELFLRTGQATDDEKLVAAVARTEQDKIATYKLPLEAIIARASQLDETRSARLYSALVKLGKPMEWGEANYVDPARIRFGTAENSGMVLVHGYPGVDILTAANALAAKAKQPALTVPTPADVSASNMLNAAKGYLAAGKKVGGNEVKPILDGIIKYYGNTKAAEEARRLQGGRP